MLTLSCPFCNALIPLPTQGEKIQCPLCGEPIPEALVGQAASLPEMEGKLAACPTETGTGQSNRTVAMLILGTMGLMAAIGLTFALWTKEWRNPTRPPIQEDKPPPGELAGLGYLPAQTDLIGAIEIKDLLDPPGQEKSGARLFAPPRPALLDLVFDQLEKRSGLRVEELDHVVFGVTLAQKIPQLAMVAITRRAYQAETVAAALSKAKEGKHRQKPFFRFSLKPAGEGVIWCLDSHVLVMLLRPDALKLPEDLETIPVPPHKGMAGLSTPLQKIVASRRIGKESSIWLAGHLDQPDVLEPLSIFLPVQIQPFAKIQSLALTLTFREEKIVVLANFFSSTEGNARDLESYLQKRKWPEIDGKVFGPPEKNQDPQENWVTLQLSGNVEAIRALLDQKTDWKK